MNILNNLNNVYDTVSSNLSGYTSQVVKKVSDISNTIQSEMDYSPILGYKTGEQGWYDQIGGGPCNKYCRYTGLNPNVQWTCSDSNKLYKLNPIPKEKSGIYCYPYNKTDKLPEKVGVVIDGNYISVESEDEVPEYNFVTYNNKTGSPIENFELSKQTNTSVPNMKLKECENLCRNDNLCKALTYNTKNSTCKISSKPIKPTEFSPHTIIANKKNHKALNGMYSIYQNNTCVNSSLFDSNPTIKKSLGLSTVNGIPQIPNKMTCPNNLNNKFIFGSNYEIMGFVSNDNTVDNTYCLQSNTNSTVSKEPCTYNKNQFWTYDKDIHTIRNWNGDCLSVETAGNDVIVSTKPCTNNANQIFTLKSAEKELQPKNSIYIEGFEVDFCTGDFKYLIYLIMLIILLVFSIKNNNL
jgi:hypothetical protein